MTEDTPVLQSIDELWDEADGRGFAGGPPEHHVVNIGARGGGRDRRVARMCRSIGERFQAITGAGLSHGKAAGSRLRRFSMPARAGLPALSYLATGNPEGRKVLFIHGTPGDATDWQPFLATAPGDQHRIAVDRPGFGESGPGRPVVSLSDQAHAIAAVLDHASAPVVIVGSSYGAPVALTLAADHPEAVSGVLLVGGAGDPGREKTHPVQRLAAFGTVATLLPRALAHSNAELLALPDQLATLAGRLGRVRAPVTILHGLKDTLVPPENATWLAERLGGAARRRVLLVEGFGHFLHIKAAGFVEAVLARVLADADRNAGHGDTPSAE